jgi:spore maturation protein CgeB
MIYHLNHPGYIGPTGLTGKQFTDKIHQFFCCVTDGASLFNIVKFDYLGNQRFDDAYTFDVVKKPNVGNLVQKIFEIAGTGSLLLTEDIQEMRDIGFIPNEHYLIVEPNNVMEIIQHCLANPKQYERIRENGMSLVQNKHIYDNRLEDLKSILL